MLSQRYISFDSLEEARAAAALGPVSFRCAVCGKGHTMYKNGKLPGTARSCGRPSRDCGIVHSVVGRHGKKHTRQVSESEQDCVLTYWVAPPWHYLKNKLPEGLRHRWSYIILQHMREDMFSGDFPYYMMLEQSKFVDAVTERARARRYELMCARTERDRKRREMDGSEEHGARVDFCEMPVPPECMGPPSGVVLPLTIDFMTDTITDGNGHTLQCYDGVNLQSINTYIKWVYIQRDSGSHQRVKLNASRLCGAMFEQDRLILFFNGTFNMGTTYRVAAYPVIGYEVLVTQRLWYKDVRLDSFVPEALDALGNK